MAFVAGKNVTVTLDAVSVTDFCSSISITRNADTLDVTNFGDSDRQFIQGLRSCTINLSGFFDNTATTGEDAKLNALLNGGVAFTFSILFTGTPNRTYSGNCFVSSLETSGDVAEVTAFSVSLQATGSVTVA